MRTIRGAEPFAKVAAPSEYHIRQRAPFLVAERGGAFTVGNIRQGFTVSHGKVESYRWSTFTVVPSLLDEAYFVQKPSKPECLAGHACILFRFKPGGFVQADGVQSQGFLLSVEAHLKRNQRYSFIDGLRDKFGIIWLLATWEDYAAEACDPVTRALGKLSLYPFQLSSAQKRDLVCAALRQALVNRSGELFHTIHNSCTNNMIGLLNHVIPQKIRLWTIPGVVCNVRATVPRMVPKYLQSKGLLGKKLPQINELNYFVDIGRLSERNAS